MIKYIKYMLSFIWGFRIKTYHSELNGELEVWCIKGKTVLYAKNANYSYENQFEIFKQLFNKVNLQGRGIKNILLLGLGAGSLVKVLRKGLNINADILAIEHDPVILNIAKEHFNIDQFENLDIVQQDALEFVNKEQNKYDAVIVDIFNDMEIPKKFLTLDFLIKTTSLLQAKGTLIFNLIANTETQKTAFQAIFDHLKKQQGKLSIVNMFGMNKVLVWEKGN